MILEYLEYHVTHHCNLNCKGCGHFSNLVEKESYGDCEQFERDLTRLSEMFENIKIIRLMGGEPLLNPDCMSFLAVSRKIFPKAKICLVTNGLLLPSMNDDFYKNIRKYRCLIQVSAYMPTKRLLPLIEKKCIKQEVELEILKVNKNMFFKQADPKGENNPIKSYNNCYSNKCTFLQNGKISICCAPFVSNLFSEKYDLSFDVCNNDWLDIYDVNMTAEKIISFIASHIPFCRYCSPEKEWFKWESVGHNVNKSDWVVNNSLD